MKFIKNIFKFVILVLITIYIFREINFKNVFNNFNLNTDLIILILTILLIIRVGVFYFSMQRWNLLLNISSTKKIPVRDISKVYTYSVLAEELFFFGFVTRSVLKFTNNINFSYIFSSTLIEKIFSFYVLLFIALCTSIPLIDFLFKEENTKIYFKLILIIFILLQIFVPCLIFLFKFKLNKFLRLTPFKHFIIYKDINKLKLPFLYSFFIQFLNILFYIFIPILLNIKFNIYEFMLLIPVVVFISVLPISFSQWGWREFVFISAFQQIGISADDSFTIGIVYGGVMLFFACCFWLMHELYNVIYK